MEKVRRFFEKMQDNHMYQLGFFVISMCIVLSLYMGMRAVIEGKKSREYVVVGDKNLVKYIEEVNVTKKHLSVSGWCFYRNIDSKLNEVQVILRNAEDEADIVWLDTTAINREDVNAYYGSKEIDYSNTGFIATTRLSKVDIENKNYEILIMLTYYEDTFVAKDKDEDIMNKKVVTTNRYICNGKYSVLKPGTDEELIKTDSEKLNKVFAEGQLLVYRDDVDMRVYQYENEIYWVAGKHFKFEEDGSTYIQYHLDTTRVDLLPENRKNANKYWDSLRFVFERAECLDEDFYPYRVAVQSIPSEYPVTCFWTGYQIENNWVWREFLNLDIRKISKGFE